MPSSSALLSLALLLAAASAQEEVCRATAGSIVSDGWCAMMCGFTPAFCPAGLCACEPVEPTFNATTPFDYADYWQSIAAAANVAEGDIVCCDEGQEDRFLYFTEADSLFRVFINSGEVEQCADVYGDPNHMVVDEDGDVWVAARTSGKLLRVVDCSDVVQVFGWPDDGVMVGGAVAFLDGKVYVSGFTDIIELTLNQNKDVISSRTLGLTRQAVGAMSAYDGCLYYTVADKNVYRLCPEVSSTPVLFLNADQYRLPDIAGLDVTSCGLVVGVADLNQIWVCDDISGDSAAECSRLCVLDDIDADSCEGLVNPWGVTWGCCCDIFAAGRTSGTIIQYDGRSRNSTMQVGDIILENRYHVKGVALVAPAPPCATVPGCNPSNNPTPSNTPSSSNTPSTTASPSSSASPTAPPSSSPSPTAPPGASWCLGSSTECDADFVTFEDDVTLTIIGEAPIIVTQAICGGVEFDSIASLDGGITWTETITFTDGNPNLGPWTPGLVIDCNIVASEASAPFRSVTVNPESADCDLIVDTVPPTPTLTVEMGDGVDICLGVRENMTVTVTSDTATDTIVSLECGAAGSLLPVQGAANSSLPATFIVANPVPANVDVVCEVVVSDLVCNEGTASDSMTTCPPIGRLVGDVRRPSQSGFATTVISVGVVSTQLFECVDLEPGNTPSGDNCRTFPEEINRVFNVPTIFLQLLINGTTLQSIDPAGVSPIIRLNPLVPLSDPTMCFIYAEPIYNDVGDSRTSSCVDNPAECLSTTTIAEACIGGFRTADKENDILPRIKGAFFDQTEAQLLETPDILSIAADICPGNTVNEYAISYAHYIGAGFDTTSDKPSLSPRPTYIDDEGVERAPAICIDTNNYPQLGGLMNQNKGTVVCLEDPDLVVSNPAIQLAGFKPPPGEVMVAGDIVPISSTGDNKDVRACSFRTVEGGTNPTRYCGAPTERQCVQFTEP